MKAPLERSSSLLQIPETFQSRGLCCTTCWVVAWPFSASGLPAATGRAASPLPYQDPRLSVEARLQDLLPRMTLEEKVAQLNLWPNLAELLKHKSMADDIALTLPQITNGVGAIEYDTKLPTGGLRRVPRRPCNGF